MRDSGANERLGQSCPRSRRSSLTPSNLKLWALSILNLRAAIRPGQAALTAFFPRLTLIAGPPAGVAPTRPSQPGAVRGLAGVTAAARWLGEGGRAAGRHWLPSACGPGAAAGEERPRARRGGCCAAMLCGGDVLLGALTALLGALLAVSRSPALAALLTAGPFLLLHVFSLEPASPHSARRVLRPHGAPARIAHRGGAHDAPENTLAAVRQVSAGGPSRPGRARGALGDAQGRG